MLGSWLPLSTFLFYFTQRLWASSIVGCSDTASVLWMSPVAKRRIPDASLNTALEKHIPPHSAPWCLFLGPV